jgi:translation initiation factor 2 alpha subunit (eIF-2alpha)
MDFIRQHYKFMIENLDVKHSGLTAELYKNEVLTRQEKEELESYDSSTRRIETLLSMLSRKSSSDFKAFLEALSQTGQGHIANKIRGELTKVIAQISQV